MSKNFSQSLDSGAQNTLTSGARLPIQRKPCQTCHTTAEQTFSCIQCNNFAFCNTHWSEWILHQEGAVGWDGRQHEKSDPGVVQRLRQILEPTKSEVEHDKDIQMDDRTTWFGVGRDSSNRPIFEDYGRFATIMTESQSAEMGHRYPQLVSFIGQTGAGKSTVIKMLIDREDQSSATGAGKFPLPVTSSTNDRIPTTGDVHLYADPSTYRTKAPILYADCEGLNGGEAIPRGVRHRQKEDGISLSSGSSRSTTYVGESKKKLRKCRYGTERDIVWAITPETKKREYAVTQLYPRLLYTFSDVVVFVLRNPRAFESTVLEKLLEWGAASIDKSLNQPALPHAVIVLNAIENADEKEWDIETATKRLLKDIEGAIYREPRFEEHASIWRNHGRTINSTTDLLKCYYASITVVRIPSRGRYMLMDDQVGKLFDTIKRKCEASLMTKKKVRMLSNSEKLQVYLTAAFDHFSRDLETPFDFIKEALKHNPIPRDFGGNILNLALSVMNKCQYQAIRLNAVMIFKKMGPMIASCIMLDSVRQSLMGTTVQLLNDAYVEFCKDALDEFANLYWPCSFESPKYGKCCNVKSVHNSKGHQNQKGRIIGSGGYQSDFDPKEIGEIWVKQIEDNLQNLQNSLIEQNHTSRDMSETRVASKLHREQINTFYRSLGNVSDFVSHSTCFSCLRELPEYALPCGHVLCLPCIQAYGQKTSRTLIELTHCPLHVRDRWEQPWEIVLKPPHAGVRVLCLDGGGIRGIVELQVLKAIQRQLGPRLLIQNFFDLIVGNSTGGIIALGLGVQNWTVDQCIKYFKELSTEAFTPREMIGIPVLEKLSMLNHGSIYKTKPFERVLKSKFDNRPLFGGISEKEEMSTKVAVTTTTSIEQHAVVLANYNRPDGSEFEPTYRFARSSGPSKELRVWEAARATSAAQPFFKPFQREGSKETYIDGALYHNCPIWVAHHERKLIWGDVAGSLPDIVLSLGTGINNSELEVTASRSSTSSRESTNLTSPTSKQKPTKGFLPTQLWNTVSDRFESLLNCNKIWDGFIAENSHLDWSKDDHHRYIRINPEMPFKVPRLDDVSALEDIEQATTAYVHKNMPRIREIVHRLVASTFFFEKESGSVRQLHDRFQCAGYICCRFTNGTDEMKQLGYFLRSCLRNDFEPYFVIEEDKGPGTVKKRYITENMIHDMVLRGTFNVQQIEVEVSKELSVTTMGLCLHSDPDPSSPDNALPLSGFPRELMTEDGRNQVTLQRSRIVRSSGDFGRKARRFRSVKEKQPHATNRLLKPSGVPLRRSWSQENLRDVFQDGGFGEPLDIEIPSSARDVPQTPEDVGMWARRDTPRPQFSNEGERPGLTLREQFVFELEA
ncbi:hypothetical protein BJ170DRAFT_478611 [Xylariales sp. AK1849]|nr:hypothetical protein BJ170DRAFT_478611 [Xylariales sp. AK1849]